MSKVIYEYPPLFEEINKAFNIWNKGYIYSWGYKIYNPTRIHIGPELYAHEAVHGQRQGGNNETSIIAWWMKYINDPEFRLDEEIPAHKAEYKKLLEEAHGNRARKFALNYTAKRLAGPIYGKLISVNIAKKIIGG